MVRFDLQRQFGGIFSVLYRVGEEFYSECKL